jgi:hypothetical protein
MHVLEKTPWQSAQALNINTINNRGHINRHINHLRTQGA